MSIRDNIVFGQHFDQNRYDKVLECCCLVPDSRRSPIATTPRSARTACLSSVVRRRELPWLARSTLVRPFFSSMMFWPPSTRTRPRSSWDDCLCGDLVRGRTVVLVTHHVEAVLAHVAHVVMLEEGRIRASGSPAELKAEGLLSMLISESTGPAHSDDKGKQAAKDELAEEADKDAAVEAQARSHEANVVAQPTQRQGQTRHQRPLLHRDEASW